MCSIFILACQLRFINHVLFIFAYHYNQEFFLKTTVQIHHKIVHSIQVIHIFVFHFVKGTFNLCTSKSLVLHTSHKNHPYSKHLHTYTYFAHPFDTLLLPNFAKLWINHVWFLFGVTPGVDSSPCHFRMINK